MAWPFKTDLDTFATGWRAFLWSSSNYGRMLDDPDTKVISKGWMHTFPILLKMCWISQERSCLRFIGTVVMSSSQITLRRVRPSLAHTNTHFWASCEMVWTKSVAVCSLKGFVSFQTMHKLTQVVAEKKYNVASKSCSILLILLTLPPSDLVLLLEMEKTLLGRRFDNTNYVIQQVRQWFLKQSADFIEWRTAENQATLGKFCWLHGDYEEVKEFFSWR